MVRWRFFKTLGVSITALLLTFAAKAGLPTSDSQIVNNIITKQQDGQMTAEDAEEFLLMRLSELETEGRLDLSLAEREEFVRDIVLMAHGDICGK